jgi:hypothetical protein
MYDALAPHISGNEVAFLGFRVNRFELNRKIILPVFSSWLAGDIRSQVLFLAAPYNWADLIRLSIGSSHANPECLLHQHLESNNRSHCEFILTRMLHNPQIKF